MKIDIDLNIPACEHCHRDTGQYGSWYFKGSEVELLNLVMIGGFEHAEEQPGPVSDSRFIEELRVVLETLLTRPARYMGLIPDDTFPYRYGAYYQDVTRKLHDLVMAAQKFPNGILKVNISV